MWLQECRNWHFGKKWICFVTIEISIKNTHFKPYPGRKSKYLQSYDRDTISKNSKKQNEFEHKIVSAERLQKCRYNFFAITDLNIDKPVFGNLKKHTNIIFEDC